MNPVLGNRQPAGAGEHMALPCNRNGRSLYLIIWCRAHRPAFRPLLPLSRFLRSSGTHRRKRRRVFRVAKPPFRGKRHTHQGCFIKISLVADRTYQLPDGRAEHRRDQTSKRGIRRAAREIQQSARCWVSSPQQTELYPPPAMSRRRIRTTCHHTAATGIRTNQRRSLTSKFRIFSPKNDEIDTLLTENAEHVRQTLSPYSITISGAGSKRVMTFTQTAGAGHLSFDTRASGQTQSSLNYDAGHDVEKRLSCR